MAGLVARDDADTYAEANVDFHEAIYAGAHNRVVADFALGLRRRLGPFRRAQFRTAGRLPRSHAEHEAVVLAILRGGFGATGKIVAAVAAIVVVALLKNIDAKFWGVVVMGGSVLIFFFLPWLDQSPVRSIRYRPTWHRAVLGVFVAFFFVLGYLGIQPPSPLGTLIAQTGTVYYFGFFLLMPWWSRLGAFKPVPERITFAH